MQPVFPVRFKFVDDFGIFLKHGAEDFAILLNDKRVVAAVRRGDAAKTVKHVVFGKMPVAIGRLNVFDVGKNPDLQKMQRLVRRGV